MENDLKYMAEIRPILLNYRKKFNKIHAQFKKQTTKIISITVKNFIWNKKYAKLVDKLNNEYELKTALVWNKYYKNN